MGGCSRAGHLSPAGDGPIIRRRLRCRGTVQGVGFRPAVYRLATTLGLTGSVRNDADGAEIEIEGAQHAVRTFLDRLASELPPLARLAELEVAALDPTGSREFTVAHSVLERRRRALVPPDARLCDDCRAEMEDRSNRRHHYPFTTCTNCGPRFSLVRSLPYDRARTSMARFRLCQSCRREYHDPADRRFHAEPVCCGTCGPNLWLADPAGRPIAAQPADALRQTRAQLAAGRIVALKGLGGFQLACRADNDQAVERLRAAKQRPSQPLALMARDLAAARRLVELGAEHQRLLESAAAPIVLAPRRAGAPVGPGVAPGLDDLGVMLPTTPLHVELFRQAEYESLVMTSGNAHDEPIARDNDEAIARLARLVDFFLLHDRDIVRRVDDSVVRTVVADVMVVRRSRGYVPAALPLPVPSPEPVLALGGHLQVTACLAMGADAVLSQHVGDLDTAAARAFLDEVRTGLEEFLAVEAGVVVVDEHPDYASTWLGEQLVEQRQGRLLRVQHHLAHAAAVLAENDSFPAPNETVAALVLDGTGYGLDGTAWGCEWLTLRGDLGWDRLGRARALPLVGGERAVREPWRVLVAAFAPERAEEELGQLRPEFKPLLEPVANLARSADWPRASGAGRVFEAAGALFGLGRVNRWEGETAVRFEALASRAGGDGGPPWPEVVLDAGTTELPTDQLLRAAARRLRASEDPAGAALGFHRTFCYLAAELSAAVVPPHVRTIALGGGCLVNRILRQQLCAEHQRRGFQVLLPAAVPPGDGGLAYGQAVLGAVALERRTKPRFRGDL